MTLGEQTHGGWMNRQVLSGLALILIGAALLAAQWQDWPIRWGSTWWAQILFLLGIIRLIDPGEEDGRPRSRRTAVWLLGIGIWGFISEQRLFGLSYFTSWPLLVVTGGVEMVWRAIEEPPPQRPRERAR